MKSITKGGKVGLAALTKGLKSGKETDEIASVAKSALKITKKKSKSIISNNSKNIKTKSSSWINSNKANKQHIANGYEPPYAEKTMVKDIVTASDEKFVRVHGPTNSPGYWIMRKSDIKGLSPEQIRNKYALPKTPTSISEVNLPKGTRVRVGVAGPQPQWKGQGGGIQYEVIDDVDKKWFVNTRDIK